MKVRTACDGITWESDLPWWRALMCKLGLHRWSYFTMSPSFVASFPDQNDVNRRCHHCRMMQVLTNDRWKGRL